MDSWDSRLFKDNSKFYLREFHSRMHQGQEVANLIDRALRITFKDRFEKKVLSVLDVPCGIGRISIPLSKLGYRVTGLDYSQDFINEAGRLINTETPGEKPLFSNADMRDLDNTIIKGKKFDIVLNYWTSFGYGTREQDVKFFKSLTNYVSKTSILIIETWHRENVIAFPFARTFYENEDLLQLIYNDISPEEDCVKSMHRVFQKDEEGLKKITEFTSVIRLYSTNELKDLLNEAGWKIISKQNNIEDLLRGATFSPLQDRIVIFAELI